VLLNKQLSGNSDGSLVPGLQDGVANAPAGMDTAAVENAKK